MILTYRANEPAVPWIGYSSPRRFDPAWRRWFYRRRPCTGYRRKNAWRGGGWVAGRSRASKGCRRARFARTARLPDTTLLPFAVCCVRAAAAATIADSSANRKSCQIYNKNIKFLYYLKKSHRNLYYNVVSMFVSVASTLFFYIHLDEYINN